MSQIKKQVKVVVLSVLQFISKTPFSRFIRLYTYIYVHYFFKNLHKSNKPLILIKTCNPDNKNRLSWGDFHLAKVLGEAISDNADFNYLLVPIDFWQSSFLNRKAKKIIFMRGVYPEINPVLFAHKTILYVISHPDKVSKKEFALYAKIVVSSLQLFYDLKGTLSNIYYIPQFTDENMFQPLQDDNFSHNVLFVGNTRGVYRESVKYCVENNIDIDVYGSGWHNFIPNKYIKGNFINNYDLPKHYCNAKITLNDHWQQMRDNGFISNRVFDVTASGGFLISDHMDEIATLFNGAVPTYSSEKEIVEKINFYLSNNSARKEHATLARKITLEKHSTKAIGKAFTEILN
jgi:hypothetical protein